MNRPADQAFWERLPSFDPSRLDPEARRWNALKWARQAQMEHASIASFDKFALQLLALGAPASLVVRCHEAAIDEIHHARIAFALASRLTGQALGPGPLPVAGDLLGDRSLAAVAAETAVDGCVGETVAAAEARLAGDEAQDPSIAAAMTCIARDEQAHADLAWAFVAWAITVGGAQVRSALEVAFAGALAGSAPAVADPAERAYPGFGHLTPERTAALRARTLDQVIRPGVKALLLAGPPDAPAA